MQVSAGAPYALCFHVTSLGWALMQVFEVHKKAPMPPFSAGATHALWTYPCEAEVVVLQARACVF